MDFIPFNTSANEQKNNSPYVLKKSKTVSNGAPPNSQSKSFSKPSFGSPASFPSFGSPALSFGSPAVHNTSYSPLIRQTSPRNFQQSTPRYNFNRGLSQDNFRPRNGSPSPRHSQNSFHFTPPHLAKRPQNNVQSPRDNNEFKTPQHCYSPRGRGNGRKSFTRQFNQTPRLDPNCNAGGSSNIDDYYNPRMVEDPWRHMAPVIVAQASKS